MKDMYIDYGGDRRRKEKRKKATIIIAVLALLIGVGGFFGTQYYFKMMDAQNAEATPDDTPISVAEAMDADEANPQTGVYGFWYSPKENEEEVVPTGYADLDEDVWMADFVDTRERVEAKGIYVSSVYINKKLNDAIKLVDETELNAMVIDIKSDAGYITYRMDYDVAKEIKACSDTIGNIEATVKKLKDHGIYLIARIVTLKDPILAERKPELALYNNDGTIFRDKSGLAWVNPYEDGVWDYLVEVCKQCVAVGFDEVNLDYIRFSTDKGMADVNFGPKAETMSRIEVITAGIKRICEEIKPLGAFVSCDVYGAIMTSSVDARIVGQSYFQMAQYLDYICPMVYPSHYADGYYNLDYPDCHPYELVYQALMASQKVLYMIDNTGNKADVRPWLQDFTASWLRHYLNYGKDEVRGQIQATYDAGYTQWLLWNAGINYTESALEKAKKE
ncbi:MAG: putative glycoside hydrolase [Lachnospiraceae bacterium]|nr:putative glycoside hydrolase [Lachnospiraceae bacterium]